jgi:hypothetical protein
MVSSYADAEFKKEESMRQRSARPLHLSLPIVISVPFIIILAIISFPHLAISGGWQRTYGLVNYQDYGWCAYETPDGGFFAAGYGVRPGRNTDVYVVRTNSNGDTLWTKTYGGLGSDMCYSAQQTSDGGHILAGMTCSYDDINGEVYIVKIDESGTRQWYRNYNRRSDAAEMARSVRQTSDGGYVMTGVVYASNGYPDIWLLKTNASGDTIWTRTYGGSDIETGLCVWQTLDKGYVISGSTYSFGDSVQVYLVKTDSVGTLQWQKTYGGTRTDFGYSVQQTSDGGYIVTAGTYSLGAGSMDAWLIKTNANGDTLWTKTFGTVNMDFCFGVQQTTDGGYILAGEVYNGGAPNIPDVLLIKTDAQGNLQWQRTYGGSDVDYSYSARQTSDGGYIVAGLSASMGDTYGDVYLIKTNPDGTIEVQEKPSDETLIQEVKISPNPFASFATACGRKNEKFILYDIAGRKAGTCQRDRIGEGLSPGVYFLKQEGQKTLPVRIVKVR